MAVVEQIPSFWSEDLLRYQKECECDDIGREDNKYNILRKHEEVLRYQLESIGDWGAAHPEIAETLNVIGMIQSIHGNHDASLQCHTEALAMLRRWRDGSSPLAEMLYSSGGQPEGWDDIDRLIAVTLSDIAKPLMRKGELAEALIFYQEALDLFLAIKRNRTLAMSSGSIQVQHHIFSIMHYIDMINRR